MVQKERRQRMGRDTLTVVAVIIAATGLLFWNLSGLRDRIEVLEQSVGTLKVRLAETLTIQEGSLTQVGNLAEDVRDLAIAVRNEGGDPVTIIRPTQDDAGNIITETADYALDLPRRAGRLLEKSAEDVGKNVKKLGKKIKGLF